MSPSLERTQTVVTERLTSGEVCTIYQTRVAMGMSAFLVDSAYFFFLRKKVNYLLLELYLPFFSF